MITKGHDFVFAVVLSLNDTTRGWLRIAFWKREFVWRVKKGAIMCCKPTTRCDIILVMIHGSLSML